METMLFIWLASVVGSVSITLIIISLVVLFVVMCCYLSYLMDMDVYEGREKALEAKKKMNSKPLKVFTAVSAAVLIFAMFLPSEKTMYMMAGGYFGQKVLVESEVSGKVMTILNMKLDKYIKEGKK